MASLVGKTLKNRYQVIESLGRGGMAEVFKVYDNVRASALALKVLRDDMAQDKIFLRRFQREAHTLAKLQHRSIVRFYGLDQDNAQVFMLMDLVEGTSLREEIFRTDKPFSSKRILEIAQPVCAALHYAHQMGVVHCDIKPGNILINHYGEVLTTDFGIARSIDSSTSTLIGAGTPAYMAPELILGKDPSPQSDIYSLGIVLYEMFTGGERPFTGERSQSTGTTAEKVRWEQMHLTPAPVSSFNPVVPKSNDAIISKCLAKDPHARFARALDLYQALESALASPRSSPAAVQNSQPVDWAHVEVEKPASKPVHHEKAAPIVFPESVSNRAPSNARGASSKKPNRFRDYWLLGAFVVLFIALIIIVQNGQANKRQLERISQNDALGLDWRIDGTAIELPLVSDHQNFNLVVDITDEYLECNNIYTGVRDFVLEARFTNPEITHKGWNYGILFRHMNSNNQYRLVIDDSGNVDLRNWQNSYSDTLLSTRPANLRIGKNKSNLIKRLLKNKLEVVEKQVD